MSKKSLDGLYLLQEFLTEQATFERLVPKILKGPKGFLGRGRDKRKENSSEKYISNRGSMLALRQKTE